MKAFFDDLKEASGYVQAVVHFMILLIIGLILIAIYQHSYISGEEDRMQYYADEYLEENAFDYVMDNLYLEAEEYVEKQSGSYSQGYDDGYDDGYSDGTIESGY